MNFCGSDVYGNRTVTYIADKATEVQYGKKGIERTGY
jgi:hypothetical protein